MKKATPGALADTLTRAFRDKDLSISRASEALGVSYEYVRKLLKGEALPSGHTLGDLASITGVSLKALEQVATADRIRIKYGKTLAEFAHKNPELDPIERSWPFLTQDQRQTVIQLVQTLASQNKLSKR